MFNSFFLFSSKVIVLIYLFTFFQFYPVIIIIIIIIITRNLGLASEADPQMKKKMD